MLISTDAQFIVCLIIALMLSTVSLSKVIKPIISEDKSFDFYRSWARVLISILISLISGAFLGPYVYEITVPEHQTLLIMVVWFVLISSGTFSGSIVLYCCIYHIYHFFIYLKDNKY